MTLPVICLHGAIGSAGQLNPIRDYLSKSLQSVHVYDFIGHGGKALPERPFSIQLFAEDLLHWMDEHKIARANIFGYSMGGYVALYIAHHHPDRIGKIMTVATKFAWSIPTAEKEVRMLDPQKIKEKVPKFAEALAERHAPVRWEIVLAKTAEMMLSLGNDPELKDNKLSDVVHSVQLCVGDRDTMVSIEETMHVFRLMKNARLAVLPNTPHPIEQMNVEMVCDDFLRFLE